MLLTLWGENTGATLVRRSQCEVKSSRKKRTTQKMCDRNLSLLWNSKSWKDIQLQGENTLGSDCLKRDSRGLVEYSKQQRAWVVWNCRTLSQKNKSVLCLWQIALLLIPSLKELFFLFSSIDSSINFPYLSFYHYD